MFVMSIQCFYCRTLLVFVKGKVYLCECREADVPEVQMRIVNQLLRDHISSENGIDAGQRANGFK